MFGFGKKIDVKDLSDRELQERIHMHLAKIADNTSFLANLVLLIIVGGVVTMVMYHLLQTA